MEEFVQLIANVGFPIAVSAYLLVRFEKIIDNNTQVVHELKGIIANLQAPGKEGT